MQKIISAVFASLVLLTATPALALTAKVDAGVRAQVGSTTVQANADARIAAAKNRADQEIDRRVTKLNDLNTKVQAMVKLSDAEKASLSQTIQAQVTELTSLKAKIDADTDTATLKTDIQSIAKSYRIYMLVMPQIQIRVAADALQATATLFSQFATKLQGRIAAGQAAGKNVATANDALTDMNAKIADVNVQITAAVSRMSGLQPDNGEKAVQASNSAAIQKSRADLKVAQADLAAARKDAQGIVQTIRSWQLDTSASASSTTSTQ